jgi:hypothetical protein
MSGRLRTPPKTNRSVSAGLRLEDLARTLEQSEQQLALTEVPEATRQRRVHPVLGIPFRAVCYLRQLARHWDVLFAASPGAPLLGRLRKDGRLPMRHAEKRLHALGRWLAPKALSIRFDGEPAASMHLISSFGAAHTTCSCVVCRGGAPWGRTCEFVAACRAAVELYEQIQRGPASPVGQHLRAVVATIEALCDIIAEAKKAAREIGLDVARPTHNRDDAERILREPEGTTSIAFGTSISMLGRIVALLRTYLKDRCAFYDLSLRDVGAVGPGAPVRRRAPEQHLAYGGLGFVRRGRSVAVTPLRQVPRERKKMADERTRFIRDVALT